MLFKRVSRSSPEVIKMVVANAQGAVLTAGYAVCFDTTATADGIRVTKCKTGALNAFAGVVDSDIATGAYGLVQVFGYRSQTYISRSTTDISAVGQVLGTQNDVWGLQPRLDSAVAKGFAFLLEDVISSAGASYTMAKAFIRAL
jgi:hypothetical protein